MKVKIMQPMDSILTRKKLLSSTFTTFFVKLQVPLVQK